MPQLLYPQQRTLVPWWTPELVWKFLEKETSLVPIRIRSLDHTVCSLFATMTTLLWLSLKELGLLKTMSPRFLFVTHRSYVLLKMDTVSLARKYFSDQFYLLIM